MKLLLTSTGITNKSIENALSEFLGKPYKKSSLAFIPTAANVEKEDKSWLINDMKRFLDLGFFYFDIVDISAVGKDIWLPSFEKADVIVFGGGNTSYLSNWLFKSGTAKVLPSLLKNKVYVGISAGSMMVSESISLSSAGILYYEKTGKFENIKGLGLVDFEIRPHLNSKSFPKVRINLLTRLAKDNPVSFYAIDDDTAIKVVNDKITVVSEGTWEKFN